MDDFLKCWLEGMPKAEALREAKLAACATSKPRASTANRHHRSTGQGSSCTAVRVNPRAVKCD